MRITRMTLAVLMAATCAAAGGEMEIARRGMPPEVALVIPQPTTEAVKYAREELRSYVERITGVRLVGSTDAQPLPEQAIILGDTRWTKELLGEDCDVSRLGTDGFRIVVKGKRLLVLGSDVRGVLYGVYELLERFGGCGWYSSTCEVVPEREAFTVPDDLDDTQIPSFVVRSTTWGDVVHYPKFAARLRINSNTRPAIPQEYGGCAYRYAHRAGIAHTFKGLIPPHEWFDSHPEYFCEVDGKRRKGNEAQPCLTHPDVLKIVVSNVFDRLAADPYARMVGVSQNDNQMYCRCARCAAVDEEEGSHCGTLLRFVNAVAGEVEKKRPDVLVQTLIYEYTRTPPKITKPRHNVVPCLCAFECSRNVPIPARAFKGDSRFMDDLVAWGKLTDHLYIWDYSTNYRNYMYPMPIEHTFKPNLLAYRENGVKYIFMEGTEGAYHADFCELKAWLNAKLMWNADADEKALLDRFFAGYYGAGAPFVREYFERMQSEVAAHPKERMGIFNQKPPSWYNADFAKWARGAFAKAEEAVKADALRLANVRYTGIAPIVTELDRFAAKGKRFFVTRKPERFTVPEMLKGDYANLMELVRQARADGRPIRFCAGLSWDPCKMAEWKSLYGRKNAPIACDKAVLDYNDLFVVSGRHVKTVPDKEGSSRRVLSLLPSSGKPMVNLNFANVAFDEKVPYMVRFRVKVVKDAGDGAAFRATLAKTGAAVPVANLGASQEAKGNGEAIELKASEVEEGYRWYSFRPTALTPKHIFQFGSGPWERGGGIGATKEVRLDCVEICRAEENR